MENDESISPEQVDAVRDWAVGQFVALRIAKEITPKADWNDGLDFLIGYLSGIKKDPLIDLRIRDGRRLRTRNT